MKQGEIWYANLNPTKGSEQAGLRPVLVVSGNLMNDHLPVVLTMPLTTSIKRYKGNPVLMPEKKNGLREESEVLVFHVRSLSKERLVRQLGTVDQEIVLQCVRTLNDLLRY